MPTYYRVDASYGTVLFEHRPDAEAEARTWLEEYEEVVTISEVEMAAEEFDDLPEHEGW